MSRQGIDTGNAYENQEVGNTEHWCRKLYILNMYIPKNVLKSENSTEKKYSKNIIYLLSSYKLLISYSFCKMDAQEGI